MVLGYITCANSKEAQILALALLKSRLIACANIQESIQSLYHSQKNGQSIIEKSQESVLIVKTSEQKTKPVINLVKKQHSYDCPCIVFYKIIDGNPEYLSWLQQQINSTS